MEAVIERGKDRPGIRLVQDSFNAASLSMYASLGFDVREPLVLIEGVVKGEVPAGYEVRPMQEEDHEACAELGRSVIGFERMNEVKNSSAHGKSLCSPARWTRYRLHLSAASVALESRRRRK